MLPRARTLLVKIVMHDIISKVSFPDILLTIILTLYYNSSEAQIIKGLDTHLLVVWDVANISFFIMPHKLQNQNTFNLLNTLRRLVDEFYYFLQRANETEKIAEDQV